MSHASELTDEQRVQKIRGMSSIWIDLSSDDAEFLLRLLDAERAKVAAGRVGVADREDLAAAAAEALVGIVNGTDYDERYAAASVLAGIVVDAIMPLLAADK